MHLSALCSEVETSPGNPICRLASSPVSLAQLKTCKRTYSAGRAVEKQVLSVIAGGMQTSLTILKRIWQSLTKLHSHALWNKQSHFCDFHLQRHTHYTRLHSFKKSLQLMWATDDHQQHHCSRHKAAGTKEATFQ